ncbi:MAG: putative phosphoribulokinase [Patescibacteria group bacterium]|nr:putative phosphoribulokinase [Patescibacteria group bacterium]
MTLEEIASKIKTHKSSRLPVLIAIEGFGGAGKTTFAEKLAKELGDTQIIHLDDFIVKEKILEPSWDKGGFDRERLEQQILRPLSRGETARYQRLIWQDSKLSEFIPVPSSRYLIIEGISSYHPSIAHYYDFKIWIDTPLPIAKERGHARDGSNENAAHWDLWAENDLRYQEKYHPELKSSFVFKNADSSSMAMPSITLQPASEKDKKSLSTLLHDYQMELLNEAGEYKYLSSYFTDSDRSAFFIYADGKVAGFVLVNKHTLIEENAHSIAEFYVVPNSRRQGIGERAAELAFRKFPGKWEVAQMEANQLAIRFWRNVIGEVTNGEYEENTLNSDIWHGPVQTFSIS